MSDHHNNDGRAGRRSAGVLPAWNDWKGLAVWLAGRAQEARTAQGPGGESQEGARALVGRLRCFAQFGHAGPHRFQVGRLAGEPVGSCGAVIDLETGEVTAPGGNDPEARPTWALWGACRVCRDAWASADDGRCGPCALAGLETDADQDALHLDLCRECRRPLDHLRPDALCRACRDEAMTEPRGLDARALAVGRLSAAADDASELAAGLGADALLWVHTLRTWPLGTAEHAAAAMAERVARCARLAARLARQALALRESADDVQHATELPRGLCLQCAERPADQGGNLVCLTCWTKAGRA